MPTPIRTATELRRAWHEYWGARSHTIIKSEGLIPTHPTAPTFTNSGMMQFVTYFLGEEPVPFTPPRAASIQKCVRAGGKHNDLDAVGKSLRHLSFFEMLGNFSFGDYFKRDAIVWAWEFVTEVLGIDGGRVWVTVHLTDDEAADIWQREIGIAPEKIQRLDKDNFWEMGETGPCGPSSELFYDFGPDHGPDGGPANPEAESRFIEFWNLVFMQFFRDASGELSPLPAKHVDTGAGLERIVGILRGSPSLFACDTLSVLVDDVAQASGRRFGDNDKDDIAMRVIADHARSATFLLADGIIPSNEDRGYVLRRIIRRAIRFAYLLGIDTAIMAKMAEHVISVHRDVYPEIEANGEHTVAILEREEAKFRKTLEIGLGILESELGELGDDEPLPGRVAFMLYDTHGFPLEITSEIVADYGRVIDVDGFQAHMAEQRQRGRASQKRAVVDDRVSDYRGIVEAFGTTEFVGQTEYTAEARVTGIVRGKDGVEVFLDKTPFYAEQGGQIGDQGSITLAGREPAMKVIDTTFPIPGLRSHLIPEDEYVQALNVGDTVSVAIDAPRRERIRRNHTTTHLVHWALREVLGDHVKQQGSMVGPDRMRFDFSHFEPMTAAQIREVEDLANREVLSNAAVEHFETTQEEALASGAVALFGEKYADKVRVVRAGPHSLELCGGTHVTALGQIGLIKITSEGSIGANLRRIEAVSGLGVIEHLRARESELDRLAEEADIPGAEFFDGVRRRLSELRDLRTENKALSARIEDILVANLAAQAEGGFLVTSVEGVEGDALKSLAQNVVAKGGLSAAVIGAVSGAGRPVIAAAVAKDSGLSAAALLEPASKLIGGGHSKRKDVSMAGGRDVSRLGDALDALRSSLGEEKLPARADA